MAAIFQRGRKIHDGNDFATKNASTWSISVRLVSIYIFSAMQISIFQLAGGKPTMAAIIQDGRRINWWNRLFYIPDINLLERF